MRPTLAMVAARTGVSKATVSKVLNGRPDVGAATRARVERALADHGYVPVRRTPKRRRPRSVSLVCDDLLSPYTSELLRGVVSAATEAEVDVVVTALESWRRKSSGGGGIIVAACEVTDGQAKALDRSGQPMVAIDALNLPSGEVTTVGSTNATGAIAATEHLIGLGHERIAFVGGPAASSCGQARLHGYRAAMSQAGLHVDAELVSHGPFVTATGVTEGLRLLALEQPPTAVFAANDAIALGVIEAARLRGLAVPADVSVVGFDDTFLAESSTPPLTTVRQSLQDLGAFALKTLLRLGAGDPPESPHVELATELVIRSSSAAPAPSNCREQ
ncbi:LacI family DNA-binding transcriptional regulator [Kribbella sp. NPDC049174]|uniref:LacI family DNA-binding transcriptional regulator n=1 Tax=Kribbella sp. NPDC049174 TaxID=3364112 RepID=UPI0037189944